MAGIGTKTYINANKSKLKRDIQDGIVNMFTATFLDAPDDAKDVIDAIKDRVNNEAGNIADKLIDFIQDAITNAQISGQTSTPHMPAGLSAGPFPVIGADAAPTIIQKIDLSIE